MWYGKVYQYYVCDLEQDWHVDTKFSREIRCKLILHVNEYPTSTMHYLGNPRHTLSMIAHDHYWLDWVFLEIPVKNYNIVEMFFSILYWLFIQELLHKWFISTPRKLFLSVWQHGNSHSVCIIFIFVKFGKKIKCAECIVVSLLHCLTLSVQIKK